jgi:hypothetical protein
MDESSEFRRQIDALIDSALKLDPEARTSFLNRACAGNPSLREKVESRPKPVVFAALRPPATNLQPCGLPGLQDGSHAEDRNFLPLVLSCAS